MNDQTEPVAEGNPVPAIFPDGKLFPGPTVLPLNKMNRVWVIIFEGSFIYRTPRLYREIRLPRVGFEKYGSVIVVAAPTAKDALMKVAVDGRAPEAAASRRAVVFPLEAGQTFNRPEGDWATDAKLFIPGVGGVKI